MAGELHNYTCTLDDQLLSKAQRELREDPEKRSQQIESLRKRLKGCPGLKARLDDAFLIKFLRARKFDEERALALVLRYYEMKRDNEEIFRDLTPRGVKHILADGVSTPLPLRGRQGEAILVMRLGRWDPEKYELIDVFRSNIVVLTHLVESEETQVNGVRLINDMSEMGWNHVKSLSPTMARRISSLLQDAFPMRLKGIHYIQEPTFFDYIFTIIRPFLKEKLQKRLNFHGANVEELHKFFDPTVLPEEYKGSLAPVDRQDFMKTLLAKQADYEENAKFGYVSMTMQSQSQKSEDAMQNMAGTFKKLNVD